MCLYKGFYSIKRGLSVFPAFFHEKFAHTNFAYFNTIRVTQQEDHGSGGWSRGWTWLVFEVSIRICGHASRAKYWFYISLKSMIMCCLYYMQVWSVLFASAAYACFPSVLSLYLFELTILILREETKNFYCYRILVCFPNLFVIYKWITIDNWVVDLAVELDGRTTIFMFVCFYFLLEESICCLCELCVLLHPSEWGKSKHVLKWV